MQNGFSKKCGRDTSLAIVRLASTLLLVAVHLDEG